MRMGGSNRCTMNHAGTEAVSKYDLSRSLKVPQMIDLTKDNVENERVDGFTILIYEMTKSSDEMCD